MALNRDRSMKGKKMEPIWNNAEDRRETRSDIDDFRAAADRVYERYGSDLDRFFRDVKQELAFKCEHRGDE